MPVFRFRWIAAALAAGLVVAAGSLPAGAQGVVKNTFADWQLRCETPAGAKNEQCALVQNVAAEDRPNVTLLVRSEEHTSELQSRAYVVCRLLLDINSPHINPYPPCRLPSN